MEIMSAYLKYLYKLRKGVMRKDSGRLELLLSNFEGTVQQKDIEKRTGLIQSYFRIKVDVPVWDNINFDWSNKEKIMEAMAERFDMPSWALYRMENSKELSEGLKKYNHVFIYQLKACNLRCPYCYVDDANKDGKETSDSKFFSIEEIVDVFIKNRNEKINRIRPSGGEPTLVIEQLFELLKKLDEIGLTKEVYVQSDTNLTTGHFIDSLIERGELRENILEEIASYKNFGLLASFKGTDPESFARNTKSNPSLFEEQFYSFGKYLEAGIDVYPFLYNPNPRSLESFIDKLVREFGKKVCKRVWVFPIKMYEVTRDRLLKEAEGKPIKLDDYLKQYEEEWKRNFEESEKIMKKIMDERFGCSYKKVLRVDV
jgi:uncharacterized Fe-S cluster-containing radical SAM superfamily protein